MSAAEMSRAELAAQESGAVVVEIYDQVYQLRGTEPAHIHRLADLVNAKMRAVSTHSSTVDSLRVAVLAALNIADELLALRARNDSLAGSMTQSQTTMRTRAGSLSGMLDEVLEERKAGHRRRKYEDRRQLSSAMDSYKLALKTAGKMRRLFRCAGPRPDEDGALQRVCADAAQMAAHPQTPCKGRGKSIAKASRSSVSIRPRPSASARSPKTRSMPSPRSGRPSPR